MAKFKYNKKFYAKGTAICVKGYLSHNTVQQEVQNYLETLYQDRVVGLRNYAFSVSAGKSKRKKIDMQLQFKPGKGKKLQTIRNVLTGKTKLGEQQPILLLQEDGLDVYLNGVRIEKKKLAKFEFQYICSRKGHVQKEKNFTSQGMREITDSDSRKVVDAPLVSDVLPQEVDMTMSLLNVWKNSSDGKVMVMKMSDEPAHDMDGTTVVPIVVEKGFDEVVEAPLVSDALEDEIIVRMDVQSASNKGLGDVVIDMNTNDVLARTMGKKVSLRQNVKEIYSIVNKISGSMGLNAEFGPIYGENRISSFQAIVEKMKDYTDLNKTSYFIDLGCGGGKPNLHVAQDPGVAVSIGVEVVENRVSTCMKHFFFVLKRAKNQQKTKEISPDERLGYNCHFLHMDIEEAVSFDPFTHLYMFDTGFPPKVLKQISTIYNNSSTQYLLCYRNPCTIIHKYKFHVEPILDQDNPTNVLSVSTNMHGSGESKHCYFYKRKKENVQNKIIVEPKFQNAIQHIKMGLDHLYQIIDQECSKIDGKVVIGKRSCTPKPLSYASFLLFWEGIRTQVEEWEKSNNFRTGPHYGRILPNALKRVFELTGLSKNQTFADIGHGLGNAVIQAAFTIGCNAVGVELHKERYVCSKALHKLMMNSIKNSNQKAFCHPGYLFQNLRVGKVHLQQGDLSDPSFIQRLAKANVIFVNNAEGIFSYRSNMKIEKGNLEQYVASIFMQQKPGSKMVTLSSLPLDQCLENFYSYTTEELEEESFSWTAKKVLLHIYSRKKNDNGLPRPTQPTLLRKHSQRILTKTTSGSTDSLLDPLVVGGSDRTFSVLCEHNNLLSITACEAERPTSGG